MVLRNTEHESVFQTENYDDYIETPFGTVYCTLSGTTKGSRPVILTYHDIGLNHKTCFSTFFNHEDMQEITRHFAVCHINAPGQHQGASTVPTGFTYPSLAQLSETIPIVLKHFKIESVIGMAVGAGAYILTHFALNHPDLVEALLLININAQADGWMDWAAHKISGWAHDLPHVVISHLFGQEEIHHNHELIATFRQHVMSSVNQTNLQQFINSYNSRRDLDIERPSGGNGDRKTLKCPTLLVVGDNSPAVDAVVDFNSKMNPTKTTLLKMADCGGLPQVHQPAKLAEAFKYFIRGLGYIPAVCMTRLSRSRTTSGSSYSSQDGVPTCPRSRTFIGEEQCEEILRNVQREALHQQH